MKRVKVKIIGAGKFNDPFRVNLPNYAIDGKRDPNGDLIIVDEIEGAAEDSIDYIKKECYVLVPDDEAQDGHLDQARIREKYGAWKDFNAGDVELPND